MSIIKSVRPSMIQLTSPTGTGYGEEWSIKLQAGLTYHAIELETNLQSVETIKKITVDIGGVPVVSVTNKMLNVLDKAYKRYQETGRFILPLSNFDYLTPQGKYQTQLVTTLTDDVTLKIEFGEKSSSDPSVPTLSGKAYVSNTDRAGRVFKPTRYELVQHAAAAGDHEWVMPNTGLNRFIQRMVFDESEVTINKIKVKRGSRVIETLTRADIEYGLKRYADVAPQSGYLILDFTLFGFGSNGALPSAGVSFEFEVNKNGAIKTYVEGFDQLVNTQPAM